MAQNVFGVVNVVTRKLRPGYSSGECETFAVIMKWPTRQRPVPAFFKAASIEVHQKLMVNELLAHEIAVLRKLPVADTCVCACRHEFLHAHGAKDCLTGRAESPYIAGIASLDSNPHSLKQRSFPGPKLSDEILRWSFCQEVAVFDELIYNIDRTVWNLLQTAPREFLIFDHDKALGGTGWTIDSLRTMLRTASHQNHMAELIVDSQDRVGIQRMLKIADEYAKNFRIPDSVADLLVVNTRIERELILQVIELLNERAKSLPVFLQSHMRLRELQLRQKDE